MKNTLQAVTVSDEMRWELCDQLPVCQHNHDYYMGCGNDKYARKNISTARDRIKISFIQMLSQMQLDAHTHLQMGTDQVETR